MASPKKQLRRLAAQAGQTAMATLAELKSRIGELKPTEEMEEVGRYWADVFRGITSGGKTYSAFLPGLAAAAGGETEARRLAFRRGTLPLISAATNPILQQYLMSKLEGESARELGLREAEATSNLLQQAVGGIGSLGAFKTGLIGEQLGLLGNIASGYAQLTSGAAQAAKQMSGGGLFGKILGGALKIGASLLSRGKE